jgi:hypothetical protein
MVEDTPLKITRDAINIVDISELIYFISLIMSILKQETSYRIFNTEPSMKNTPL